ncbi:MAG: hypothetical protein KF906_05135 [Actinobacteria bacterium]|nr:hypothetical protein [Actinomycetota bacterium]
MTEELQIEFCGELQRVEPPGPFLIGREADLSIDDNPYLHRSFLEVRHDRFWWVTNVGSHLAATISDSQGTMSAWLSPGASLPLLFGATEVRFSAGPTSYLLSLVVADGALAATPGQGPVSGTTTITPMRLTENQLLLVLSLAEEVLLAGSTTAAHIPSSKEAADRLGWTITKFNRQLDAVCQKLTRGGVGGLHGNAGQLASGRRSRLVEYAVATRLITVDDLPHLDSPTEP